MMIATLYLPQQPPQAVPTERLSLPDPTTGFAQVTEKVSTLLGCAPELVDVLAIGPDYVAYSVFDSEESVNEAAMTAVAAVSGVVFDVEDDDTVLRGAVLVLCN
jgi:hypothetical protein